MFKKSDPSIHFLIVTFSDNAGVIVNPKGEMKGMRLLKLLLLYKLMHIRKYNCHVRL